MKNKWLGSRWLQAENSHNSQFSITNAMVEGTHNGKALKL